MALLAPNADARYRAAKELFDYCDSLHDARRLRGILRASYSDMTRRRADYQGQVGAGSKPPPAACLSDSNFESEDPFCAADGSPRVARAVASREGRLGSRHRWR